MELESVLSELRVDWESVISENFDPVPLINSIHSEESAGAADFRNIYHKVEQAMNSMVENNFKAFNDSVLLYTKFHRINDNNIRWIGEQVLFYDEIICYDPEIDFDSKDIRRKLWMKKMCDVLREYRDILYNVERALSNKNHVHASSLLGQAFATYARYNLGRIRGLEKLGQRAKENRNAVISAICRSIEEFLRDENNIEYVRELEAIVSLSGLKSLDDYLHKNIKLVVLDEYRRILNDFGRFGEEMAMESVVQSILHTTNKMFFKFLRVSESGFKRSTENTDIEFFGVELASEMRFFNKEHKARAEEVFCELLKSTARLFAFENQQNLRDNSFDLSEIRDLINYADIFDKRFAVFEKLSPPSEEHLRLHTQLALPFRCAMEFLFLFAENMQYLDESLLKREFAKFLQDTISEKYFKQRNNEIERRMIFLLKDESNPYRVDRSGLLCFFKKISFDAIFYKKEQNDTHFLNFIFEIVARKLKILFFKIFGAEEKGSILASTGCSPRFQQVPPESGLLPQPVGHIAESSAMPHSCGDGRRGDVSAGPRLPPYRIDQFGEFQVGVADKIRADADVGVENLAGKGIGARRSHCVPLAGLHHPAHCVVAHIGCVPLGIVWLLLGLNCPLKAEWLECLVPH